MQVLRIGDLVAHKHYPENAIGKISKFYDSGRVGVVDGCRLRSFLPGSLLLWHGITPEPSPETPLNLTKLPLHVTEEMLDDDDLEPPSASCRCPKPVAPITPGEVEEVEDVLATFSEVIERPPTHPLSLFQKFDAIATSEVMEHPRRTIAEEVELTLKKFPPVKWQIPELLPVPRDLISEQMPEWWERPALPDMENPDCPIGDDEDDWEYALEFEFFFRAQYRGWLIETNDEKNYATEPSSKKCWWCECDLDLDGPDGQIAIAQEFIDSWYFAQPSPGQLSLSVIEAVARDPQPPPRLTA